MMINWEGHSLHYCTVCIKEVHSAQFSLNYSMNKIALIKREELTVVNGPY